MLSHIVVIFLTVGTVLAQSQALAVQKEDFCFSYIECYEKNPTCAVEYCNGPPGLGSCAVEGPETAPYYKTPDAPIRNECCQQSNPYDCYQSWAASQPTGATDGSAGLEGNAQVPSSSVMVQSSGISTKTASTAGTLSTKPSTTGLTNPTSSASSTLTVTSGTSISKISTQSTVSGISSSAISTAVKSATTSTPSVNTVNAGPAIAPYAREAGLYAIGGIALAALI